MSNPGNPTSDLTAGKPLRPRRWIPLSLRFFAVVMALLGIVGFVPIYRQHLAIRAIERLGGQVSTKNGRFEFLRRWIGNERMKPFDDVELVYIKDCDFTDANLVHFQGLRCLERLVLNNTHITGAGFIHLAGLKKLESIMVHNSPVNDAGVNQLTRLKTLKVLFLRKTRITRMGVEDLQRAMPDLKVYY